MATMIRSFTGQHRFLSNFFPSPVEFEGLVFPTVEHGFQAAKRADRMQGNPAPAEWFEVVRRGAVEAGWPRHVVDGWSWDAWVGMFKHSLSPHTAVTRMTICGLSTPGEAKKAGRRVQLRPDWDAVRIDVMLSLLRAKFSVPTLAVRLLDTGDAELVEGNTWHDNFWGNCTCARCAHVHGQNWLGCALMVVRSELKKGTVA